MKKSIQIVGPFFTNYSLAKVNRNLAYALDQLGQYDIFMTCPKERIDYWPTESEIQSDPFYSKAFKGESLKTDIAIYNNFPKTTTASHNFHELDANIKIMYIAWEDNIYPQHWVDEINEHLDAVLTASTFVEDILTRSGVKVPIMTIPNAVDKDFVTLEAGIFALDTKKNFKFFHSSTAKMRKGVDVMLKAYFEEFTKNDDVTLVIKSFPSMDNSIDSIINELQTENSPEVIHINTAEMSEKDLKSLTSSIDCGVFPSRGEGFGVPILECMYLGKPSIVTGYSGYMDFCNEQNSFLVDYKLENAHSSEVVNIGAKWAEPDYNDLKSKMREAFETRNSNSFNNKGINSKAEAENYNYLTSAKKLLNFLPSLESIKDLKNYNVAVITSMNDESGISVYSQEMYSKVESSFQNFYYFSNKDISDRTSSDSKNVIRNWSVGEESFDELLSDITTYKIDMVHVQYHSSGNSFTPESLDKLISELNSLNVKIFVTFHSFRGDGFDYSKSIKNLAQIDKIFLMSEDDYQLLSKTLKNVSLINHGRERFPHRLKSKLKNELDIADKRPVVATHGLLNINKGTLNLLKSIEILKQKYPKIFLLAVTAVSSNNIFAQGLKTEITDYSKSKGLDDNFLLVPDFLSKSQVYVLMQASDVIVFPYLDTAGESASGAVSKGLASENPVIVSDIKAFKDLNDEVLKIQDNSPEAIASAIAQTIENPTQSAELVRNSKKYIFENSYLNSALETIKYYLK